MTVITQLRSRGEMTIPKEVREHLRVKPFDLIGIDLLNDGTACIHRRIHYKEKKNNNNQSKGGGEGECEEKKS